MAYRLRLKDVRFQSHLILQKVPEEIPIKNLNISWVLQMVQVELHTQLILTYELNLIEKNKIDELLNLITEIQKMNYSFQLNLGDVSILNTKI